MRSENKQKLSDEAGEQSWVLWFMPVILATQEVEVRRIGVRSQPGLIVRETHLEKTLHKKESGSRYRS
jgi:hypothetical protein